MPEARQAINGVDQKINLSWASSSGSSISISRKDANQTNVGLKLIYRSWIKPRAQFVTVVLHLCLTALLAYTQGHWLTARKDTSTQKKLQPELNITKEEKPSLVFYHLSSICRFGFYPLRRERKNGGSSKFRWIFQKYEREQGRTGRSSFWQFFGLARVHILFSEALITWQWRHKVTFNWLQPWSVNNIFASAQESGEVRLSNLIPGPSIALLTVNR